MTAKFIIQNFSNFLTFKFKQTLVKLQRKTSMSDEFQQKAQKLLSKLSNLQPSSILHSRKNDPSLTTKQTFPSSSLHQLQKFQQEIQQTNQQNRRKTKVLHQEISKLQGYLLEENEARNKISENFVATATKVEKNMKVTLQNIARSFEEKERRLEGRIEQILSSEQKELQAHAQQNQALISQITSISKQLTTLQDQLQQMKRSRYQLQQKIYKQFIDQIKQLRKIYDRDLRQREQRESQLVECLKGVYTGLMEQVKREELEREQNEKGFLTVVEQVIARIVEY